MQITSQLQKQKSQKSKSVPKHVKPTPWEGLVNSLVRPPRLKYNQSQLGSQYLKINNQNFIHQEHVVFYESKKLQLTTYIPEIHNHKLILYLHGNSSSRLQGKSLLIYLPPHYSLAAFDFIGCGNNLEKDVITLGYDQSKQVQSIVNYLKSKQFNVYLWGRSMGAVSALKYGKSSIIVADSPFRTLKKLCKDLTKSDINPFPTAIVNCLFPCVFMKLSSDIKAKGGYDVSELDIQKAVKQINKQSTIIFLSGSEDTLINHKNSQKLFQLFPGNKKYLQIVPGNHNTTRPQAVMNKIMKLIDQHSERCNTQQTIQTKQIKVRL